jgi:hypothetical protein
VIRLACLTASAARQTGRGTVLKCWGSMGMVSASVRALPESRREKRHETPGVTPPGLAERTMQV